MFTLNDLQALLNTRPFVPFRIYLSDGGTVDVRHRELVNVGRRFAFVGLPDANQPESVFDKYTLVWYMHVTRTEALAPGAPPEFPGSGPAPSQAQT